MKPQQSQTSKRVKKCQRTISRGIKSKSLRASLLRASSTTVGNMVNSGQLSPTRSRSLKAFESPRLMHRVLHPDERSIKRRKPPCTVLSLHRCWFAKTTLEYRAHLRTKQSSWFIGATDRCRLLLEFDHGYIQHR